MTRKRAKRAVSLTLVPRIAGSDQASRNAATQGALDIRHQKLCTCERLSMRIGLLTVGVLLGTCADWNSAQAQAVPPVTTDLQNRLVVPHNDPVTERDHPEFDPLGLRIGPNMIEPTLPFALGYTSNEKAVPTGSKSDEFFAIAPSIRGQTNWAVHALSAGASITGTTWAKSTEDNSVEYNLDFSGRADITRDANVGIIVFQSRLVEPRNSTNVDPDTLKPNYYDQTNATLVGYDALGRIQLAGEASLIRQTFGIVPRKGGAVQDFTFRDGNQVALTGVVGYSISPSFGVYSSVGFDSRTYDKQSVVFNRDANGSQILAGVRVDLANLVGGDLAVGYKTESVRVLPIAVQEGLAASPNDQGGTKVTIGGLRVRIDLNFYPTALTNVKVGVVRDTSGTGLSESSTETSTRFSGEVYHELLRNVLLSARLGYRTIDYVGINRRDKVFEIGAQGRWQLNRRLGLVGQSGYSDFQSTGLFAFRPFEEFRTTLSFVLSY